MGDLKLIELFSGIGAFSKALESFDPETSPHNLPKFETADKILEDGSL